MGIDAEYAPVGVRSGSRRTGCFTEQRHSCHVRSGNSRDDLAADALQQRIDPSMGQQKVTERFEAPIERRWIVGARVIDSRRLFHVITTFVECT